VLKPPSSVNVFSSIPRSSVVASLTLSLCARCSAIAVRCAAGVALPYCLDHPSAVSSTARVQLNCWTLSLCAAQSADQSAAARHAVLAYTAGLRRRSDTHGPGGSSMIAQAAAAARTKLAHGSPDGADGIRAVSSYVDNLRRASRVRFLEIPTALCCDRLTRR